MLNEIETTGRKLRRFSRAARSFKRGNVSAFLRRRHLGEAECV